MQPYGFCSLSGNCSVVGWLQLLVSSAARLASMALTVAIDWGDLSLVLVGPKDEWLCQKWLPRFRTQQTEETGCIRRDDKDFVVASQPEDVVIFRNGMLGLAKILPFASVGSFAGPDDPVSW
jgi:hypothetical protein